MALLVQRDLAAVGVDMQLEAVPIENSTSASLTGDFDAVLIELIVGNTPSRPFTFWHRTSRQNSLGYQKPLSTGV